MNWFNLFLMFIMWILVVFLIAPDSSSNFLLLNTLETLAFMFANVIFGIILSTTVWQDYYSDKKIAERIKRQEEEASFHFPVSEFELENKEDNFILKRKGA